jgi:hypothetical protein
MLRGQRRLGSSSHPRKLQQAETKPAGSEKKSPDVSLHPERTQPAVDFTGCNDKGAFHEVILLTLLAMTLSVGYVSVANP